MTNMRRNVWDLGNKWADPILWYARGVGAMRSRALDDPLSWRFYAAMHGINAQRWQFLGYLSASDRLPSDDLVAQFWNQCQHGSWYFLPWHRGYLHAFEETVRAEIVELGGPADWALPYWNYFKPRQARMPLAFGEPDWPDGIGNNPLFVRARYGPAGNGTVFVPTNLVNLQAMNETDFTATINTTAFGGIDTGFEHDSGIHGGIEAQPHDMGHVYIGGTRPNADPADPGVMTRPSTAGLDPIFWLHHANIDRLWASWARSNPNPTEPRWLGGPVFTGGRRFVLPVPDGKSWKEWPFAPADVLDTVELGYEYDDLTPGAPPVLFAERQDRRDVPAPAEGGRAVPQDSNVELVGATTEPVPVRGSRVGRDIRLDAAMRRKVTEGLAPSPRAAGQSDRLFLNLENVRGNSDAAAFDVYVGVPTGEDPADHPDRLAGTIGPFGITEASSPGSARAGQGLSYVLDITGIVDGLHLDDAFDVDELPVQIVPYRPLPDEVELSIGRISIYRQGAR